jgi:hypothetical protein
MQNNLHPMSAQHSCIPAAGPQEGSRKDYCWAYHSTCSDSVKGLFRLSTKIRDKGFKADLYKKHWHMHTLSTVQYRHNS